MYVIIVDLIFFLFGNLVVVKRDEEDVDVGLMSMLRTERELVFVGLGFDYEEGREKLG